MSILLKLFPKIAEEEILPSSFYEAMITLTQKAKIPHTHTHTQNYMLISLMNTDTEHSTKYQQTESNKTLKGPHTTIKWDLSQGCKDSSTSTNQCDTPH